MKDEALKLALEALKKISKTMYHIETPPVESLEEQMRRIADKAITAIKQAFAAPTVQEPEIVQRVKRYAGQTMRTARNPNITARECIELANWIADTTPPAQPAPGDIRAAQPAPVQPVAWMHEWDDGERIPMLRKRDVDSSDIDSPKSVRPLVFGDTTPPAAQRPWVGLTAGERDALFTQHYQWDDYGKAIEAKLKEKNT
jgi:hypothetical protein